MNSPSNAAAEASGGTRILSALLAGLPVAVCETREDPADAVLYPEEAVHVAKAVDKRRREFTTARHCARTALARIGVPPGPIPRGEKGEPIWPDGVVGTMTHCAGYRAAVVAEAAAVTSLGIDAEPAERLSDPGVLDLVSDEAERAALAALAAEQPSVPWDRLLFSAKESVYKTWFPLARRWLGFEDAHLTIRADGTFSAKILIEGPLVAGSELTGLDGLWTMRDGVIATAIVLRPE
ncbi:4'-phosphopantetheinyl transferase Npt [Streptomyces sp. YIM 121038]|uniref:4'-phosphopantetheinyl transferase family protein n=1 Tax=Streptomyces sp. YIM 121038 TaxID=2136401 RepID=UPI00116215B9|nr:MULTISPECIES: 4'-phosphopantetheinyl transferase superfamily protein [unclassified Streptomyces]QCX75035.1 4'-phosphopantetheinyl transferase Npt [Streptomyces sp. YIM 121038]